MAPDPGLEGMVDGLSESGALRSPSVRAALLAVDRARFVPGDALDAYRDAPVVLQLGPGGEATSTISQPTMVVLMLEELAMQPGDRVLEVGTASGWNAALLAHLVGVDGLVVTIEIDESLSEAAGERLSEVANVWRLVGDGRDGWPEAAPYDGIIITAGAREVAPAWREQLAVGGRLVVPITGSDGTGLCITYERVDGELVERASTPCVFVPLR